MSYREQIITRVLRGWIHETPLSKCGPGEDTCPDWGLASEVAERIERALRAAGL